MKKIHLSFAAAVLLSSITFVGCSSSSSNTDTQTGTLQLNPYLGNVNYRCGTHSGVTDANGHYNYSEGDTCTFTLGGVELTALPEANLTIDEILENSANVNVSKEAIWGYMSAATGLSQSEMSAATKISLTTEFKNATNDITDFSSFDKVETALLADSDFNSNSMSELKSKFEKNKAKIDSVTTSKRVEVKFEEIDTPITEQAQNTQQVTTKVYVNGEAQTIGYSSILKTGDSDNGQIFGLLKDYQDNNLSLNGEPYLCNGTNGGVGSGLDFSSFLNVNDKLYMVSQFECGIGGLYMTELNQNTATGALTAKSGTLKYISQKNEFGGFVHCAGQKTPWESHLGSEEYEPDAKATEDSNVTSTVDYGNYNLVNGTLKYWQDDKTKVSPYYYGWTPEVTIDTNGNPNYAKHYSMGRFAHELSYVMPDNKTVYMSDDGTNVGLFMFVADVPKDLSAGTLYAAKWNQTSATNGGSANLTWINLGHATSAEIRAYLDKDNNVATNDGLKFSDIFETETPSGGICPTTGFTSINASAGNECLKIKDGMEKAASRLETRRYAAIKGATTEFNKEEGITYDKNSKKLYVSMSSVEKGMENGHTTYDVGGNNDIQVAKNKCGSVYALDVNSESSNDTNNTAIASTYVVKNMYGVISGTPTTYASTAVYTGNTCDVNGISNPDNITFLPNSNILTIGEDTSAHKNNMVWGYNVKTKELTRTFTTPLGAETTSPFWYTDLKDGFGYLSVVTQHPDSGTTDAGQSAVGYVGPFKNLTTINESNSISSITKLATLDKDTANVIEGASEIVAFDSTSKKMFVTNGATNKIDVAIIGTNGTLTVVDSIDLSSYGASVQSVAVKNGKVAVAVGSANKVTTKGKVVVFDTVGNLLSQTTVGYLPDMVTFNEDGTKVIVANEGEPEGTAIGTYTTDTNKTVTTVGTAGDYVDVKGSIGVITLANADTTDNANGYAEITFDNATLTSATDGTPVRLGGTPSNNKALDIEPEYIAVSGNYAYVTLQENNAIAKVNISGTTPTLELVKSFGAKSYETNNTIDIEEEGYALMKNYAGLYGLYMPDSIASYKVGDTTYLVTANEGDGREYPVADVTSGPDTGDVLTDDNKISKLSLDSSIASIYANENDLKVMKDMGDTDSDGDYDKLYTFGGRSFSIWSDNGTLVFDSGDQLSKLTAKMMPTLFNQDDGTKDGRSGNKGVEPEALAVGQVGTKTYAFVGLERQNAIVVYDITSPSDVKFVQYIITETDGDISPEGMKFVSASESPTGNALLLVAFEISGTTAVYEIK